jgi:hypothetical protein
MTKFVTRFVTHFLRCDAAKGGLRRKCGPKYEGRIVCDAPKATRSRVVTQVVTQVTQASDLLNDSLLQSFNSR